MKNPSLSPAFSFSLFFLLSLLFFFFLLLIQFHSLKSPSSSHFHFPWVLCCAYLISHGIIPNKQVSLFLPLPFFILPHFLPSSFHSPSPVFIQPFSHSSFFFTPPPFNSIYFFLSHYFFSFFSYSSSSSLFSASCSPIQYSSKFTQNTKD